MRLFSSLLTMLCVNMKRLLLLFLLCEVMNEGNTPDTLPSILKKGYFQRLADNVVLKDLNSEHCRTLGLLRTLRIQLDRHHLRSLCFGKVCQSHWRLTGILLIFAFGTWLFFTDASVRQDALRTTVSVLTEIRVLSQHIVVLDPGTHHIPSFVPTMYFYYCMSCSSSALAWCSAMIGLVLYSVGWHAETRLNCQVISLFLAYLMAEGRPEQNLFGALLVLWHPWFPPTCNRCDGDHHGSQCPHFLADRDADEDAWLHYGNVPEASQADGNNIFPSLLALLKGGSIRAPLVTARIIGTPPFL